jgi:hypothetical protein
MNLCEMWSRARGADKLGRMLEWRDLQRDRIWAPHGVELDRPELPEGLEHGGGASLVRPRRRQEVPGDEKTACGLSRDLHPDDASYMTSMRRKPSSGLEPKRRIRASVRCA